MSHIPMPINAAHQHAANAEDYLGNGLLIPALEEHLKAAEAYLTAIDRSNDESAKRTLRMLYNEHCKTSKELERRIEKLKEEGKDPSLPQKLEPPQRSATQIDAHPHIPRSLPSTPPVPMTESQNPVDESFMLLAGQRSDPGDAFNQFWNIMQGMLDNLSQPVAFATVPLGNIESVSNDTMRHPIRKRDTNHSSDTDMAEEPMLSRFTRSIGIIRPERKVSQQDTPSTTAYADNEGEDFEEGIFNEETLGDELSESFFVVPSGNDPSPATLRKENEVLKAEIDATKQQLEAAERLLLLRREQDTQLRDSIYQATREAQKVMGASMIGQRPGGLDLVNLNLTGPSLHIPGMTSSREAQYARRLKELEDELRAVRAENEKHKAMITKFKEKWEKLKESAKRKKEARATATASSHSARERIVEEPEAEEELDGAH